MLTPKGEESLRTEMIGRRPATPEELMVLEIHKRCPDAANAQELAVQALLLADGDADHALECIRNGEFEFEKKFH